jgi:transposase
MEWWTEIRRKVLVEGVSKRRVVREYGIHWETLEKILTHSSPPGYRMKKERPKPKIGPYLERIRQIIEEDKAAPKKQRHTAKRIFERIRCEGYEGGHTQVKEAVRTVKQVTREVFVPLVHRPGEAQADFGHALVRERGALRKVVFFARDTSLLGCGLHPGVREDLHRGGVGGAPQGLRVFRLRATADSLR